MTDEAERLVCQTLTSLREDGELHGDVDPRTIGLLLSVAQAALSASSREAENVVGAPPCWPSSFYELEYNTEQTDRGCVMFFDTYEQRNAFMQWFTASASQAQPGGAAQKAILAEREACAQIVDDKAKHYEGALRHEIALEIRTRPYPAPLPVAGPKESEG